MEDARWAVEAGGFMGARVAGQLSAWRCAAMGNVGGNESRSLAGLGRGRVEAVSRARRVAGLP